MSHSLSTLGVIHTAVSLVPVIAGLYAFICHRAIDPPYAQASCTFWDWCCRSLRH